MAGLAKIGPAQGEQRQNATKGKNIIIGVFFDGTCNNMYNTDDRKSNDAKYLDNKHHWYGGHADEGDDSYENDYSNIARLYKNYVENMSNYQIKSYIEGIGTTNHDGDDTSGYAFGTGDTGIPAKVKKGCLDISTKIKKGIKKENTKIINTLTIDVFGFSRGAAAARHFVYEITKPAYKATQVSTRSGTYLFDEMGNPSEFAEFPYRGYLGAYTKGIEILNLVIRFVGLFDTVASYASMMAIPSPFSDDTPDAFENDTNQLHLDAIAKAEVKKVVHLTAADEARKYFPLTNIKSAGNKGIEKELPGVHSDIGGSYKDGKEDIKRLMQVNHFYSKYLLEDFKDDLIKEGWYLEKELSVEIRPSDDYFQYCLRGNRDFIISKMYSFIPLYFMCELALNYDTKKSIPFDLSKLQQQYSISGYAFMQTIKDRLHKYVFDGAHPMKLGDSSAIRVNEAGQYIREIRKSETENNEIQETANLMALRRYYLHQSANYDRHTARTEPMAPRIENKKRKREHLAG